MKSRNLKKIHDYAKTQYGIKDIYIYYFVGKLLQIPMWILTRKKKHSIIKHKDYVKLKVITVFTNELLEHALGEESESGSWKAAPCSCVHAELVERALGE